MRSWSRAGPARSSSFPTAHLKFRPPCCVLDTPGFTGPPDLPLLPVIIFLVYSLPFSRSGHRRFSTTMEGCPVLFCLPIPLRFLRSVCDYRTPCFVLVCTFPPSAQILGFRKFRNMAIFFLIYLFQPPLVNTQCCLW